MLHVDFFKSALTEKGRSPVVEPPDPPVTVVENALVVLTSVEKQDEKAPHQVAEKAAAEIAATATNLKVENVLLHPFAHLFAELSRPEMAVKVMDMVKEILLQKGYQVSRTPFGWFNTLEIKAKGHPYSRVARIITPD